MMIQSSPSWFAWNVKIVGNFSIFLLVIPVLVKLHILKDFSSCPYLTKFFLHSQPLCFIFYLLALFKKGFWCKPFCKFYFSFYAVWFGPTLAVRFWTSSGRSTWMTLCLWWSIWTYISLICFLQSGTWPTIFTYLYLYLLFYYIVSHSQEYTFLLKLKIISLTSSSHSSLLLICSSICCLHSPCAATANFRMSLNCANSSSTATLFLLEFSSENCITASYLWSETI